MTGKPVSIYGRTFDIPYWNIKIKVAKCDPTSNNNEVKRLCSIKICMCLLNKGVAMLSRVLNSRKAIVANIQIMRAFVNLRRTVITCVGLKRKIDEMEKKHDGQFSIVFEAIRQLMEPPQEKPKGKIGFHP
jgi:hypothetical protein